MNVISVLLMTLWFASMVLDFTLGGLSHVLAVAAVLIVLTTHNHEPKPARPARS